MIVRFTLDQVEWFAGFEESERYLAMARTAIAQTCAASEHIGHPKGDCQVQEGPHKGRWIKVRCTDRGVGMFLIREEIQASILVLAHPTLTEQTIDLVGWISREEYISQAEQADDYLLLASERFRPMPELLQRLRVPIRRAPRPLQSVDDERLDRFVRSQKLGNALMSAAQQRELENAKPQRDYKDARAASAWLRAQATGTCKCGDALYGASGTCFSCNSAKCDICGGRTASPIQTRCHACNFRTQEHERGQKRETQSSQSDGIRTNRTGKRSAQPSHTAQEDGPTEARERPVFGDPIWIARAKSRKGAKQRQEDLRRANPHGE